MIYFEIDNWLKIIKQFIDESDLYKPEHEDFGLCKYPHTTILFGLHHDNDLPNLVKEYLIPFDELNDIYVKNISLFENEECDVVKMDIKSKDLKKMNKKLRDNFEYTSDHPDYHPHLTIAYVKKGKGEKYTTKISDKIKLEVNKYVYSSPEFKKTTINI
jgi:2'-5' RNA ligase